MLLTVYSTCTLQFIGLAISDVLEMHKPTRKHRFVPYNQGGLGTNET